MPKYRYTLKNGQSIVLEGDTQPSDAEVESAARQQGVELQQAHPQEDDTADIFHKGWEAINKPLTTIPSQVGEAIGEPILAWGERNQGVIPSIARGTGTFIKSFGDVTSGLSSPLNLGITALSGGTGIAARAGAPRVANALNLAARAAAVPQMAHGAQQVAEGKDWTQRLMGMLEFGMGGYGLKSHMPHPDPKLGDLTGDIEGLTASGNRIGELGRSLREPKQLNLFDNMNPEPKGGQLNLFDPPETPSSPGTSPTPPRTPPPPPSDVPPGWLPFDYIPQDRPPTPEPPPYREPAPQELPYDEPQQLPLPLGAYQGARGRFTNQGPPLYRPQPPFLQDPIQQQLDLGVEPPSAIDTAPSTAAMPPGIMPQRPPTEPPIPPTAPPPIVPPPAPPSPPPPPTPVTPTTPPAPIDTAGGIAPIPPSFFDRMGEGPSRGPVSRGPVRVGPVNVVKPSAVEQAATTQPPIQSPVQTQLPDMPVQQPRSMRDVLEKATSYEDLSPEEIQTLNKYLKSANPNIDEPMRQRAGRRPYTDLTPEVPKRYHVYDANDNLIDKTYDRNEAHRWAEENDGYVKDVGEGFNPDEDIARARIKGGGLTASVDIRRAVENITKDYTSPLSGIMTREGMQNALDATEKLGGKGEVRIRFDYAENAIEIHDNGSGLDEDQLANKLVEIFASGKEGEAGATGGKGIGSASYIYGGRHFEIETTAVDKIDGKKYRIKASGTPEQFLDQVKGSDFEKNLVPDYTPTGTNMKVKLKPGQDIIDARKMLEQVIEHSRNRTSRIINDEGNISRGEPLSGITPDDVEITSHNFKPSTGDKLIGKFVTKTRNSDVEVLVPPMDPADAAIPRNEFKVHYLNNGMYQFSEPIYLSSKGEGIPEHVIVDIHPLVDDLDDNYPFINTREDIKKDIRNEVTEFIDKNIKAPGLSRRKNRIQELYDSMSPVSISGTKRRPVIYDPGNRLTPQEVNFVNNHPVIKQLVQTYDKMLDNMLNSIGRPAWSNRLEGIGIVFDPESHGLHIPNPTSGKSTILFNPFLRIESMPPKEAAWKATITGLHEVGHIGKESGMPFNLSQADMKDPRLGEFLSAHMNQVVEHGDVWRTTGHDMGFVHRLGEVFASYGIENTFNTANELHSIYTGGAGRKSSGYSPEIQRLLQLYNESRGRAAVTEDLLSSTGVKQGNRKSTGKGSIPSNNKANEMGVPGDKPNAGAARGIDDPYAGYRTVPVGTRYRISPQNMNKRKMTEAIKLGFDFEEIDQNGMIVIKKIKESPSLEAVADPNVERNAWADAANIPRTIMASQDMSAPLRQGLGLIHKGAFWKAIPGMMKSWGSEEMYQSIQNSILDDPMFRKAYDARGKIKPSYAEAAGLKLTDLNSITSREESILSSFAEKVPGVRRSNRAYTAFLNKLRADTFKQMMKDFGVVAGQDTEKNLALAKQIAEFVNTASGRGSLGQFETSGKVLSSIFFSPRLLASRLGMMAKGAQAVFSPEVYMMRSPSIRREYLKSLGAIAAVSGSFVSLMKLAGAEVESDPASSDFGKAKFGDTRIDPYGGFQQPIVLAQRMMPFIDLSTQGISEIGGLMKSTTTGREYSLDDPGFGRSTRADVLSRFFRSKTNPIINFGWGLLAGQKELSGKDMNLTAFDPTAEPGQGQNLFENSIAQRFIPMLYQDMYELYNNENTPPEAKVLAAFMASVGMGSQTYGNAGE
jgi:hypothetical protein